MSASDSCVCRRMFKSRIVERMAFSAGGLTAGLKPQNIELSRDFLIHRGRKQYPRKSAYAYLKSTRGRGYADQVGIPFWRLRQACQYDTGCIRQVQVQAINAYQVAGAPIVIPQPSMTGAFEATNSQRDPSAELHLCRNSNDAADKIAHCSNVIAQSSNVSALVTAHNTRGLALMDAGRFGEAVDDFTFVIRHEPQIAGFYDNRQNAYRRSGRLDGVFSIAR